MLQIYNYEIIYLHHNVIVGQVFGWTMLLFVESSESMWEMSSLCLVKRLTSNTKCWYGISVLISLLPLRMNSSKVCQMAFITETTSSSASSIGAEEIWEELSNLLKAVENVCWSTKKHQWWKESWWWNAAVDSAVQERRICWKTLKNGGSKEEYQKAKHLAKHAVYLAKFQSEQNGPQGPFTQQLWPMPPRRPNEARNLGCSRQETCPQWHWIVLPGRQG